MTRHQLVVNLDNAVSEMIDEFEDTKITVEEQGEQLTTVIQIIEDLEAALKHKDKTLIDTEIENLLDWKAQQ